MSRFVRLAIVGLATIGCSSPQGTTSPVGPSVPIVRLRAEPYSFAFYSGMDQPARLVIRDAATWHAVWNKIYDRQSPIPSVPAIDFSQEMLVLAALGTRSSGGFGILLDGASENGNGSINVAVRSISPGPRCVVTAALTQPVDIARLSRRDGSVRFLERSEVFDCK